MATPHHSKTNLVICQALVAGSCSDGLGSTVLVKFEKKRVLDWLLDALGVFVVELYYLTWAVFYTICMFFVCWAYIWLSVGMMGFNLVP